MSAIVPPPIWPADPGHRDAIDTLRVLAEAEDRGGEPRRAVALLDTVERIVGTLPRSFERMRWRCRGVTSDPRLG